MDAATALLPQVNAGRWQGREKTAEDVVARLTELHNVFKALEILRVSQFGYDIKHGANVNTANPAQVAAWVALTKLHPVLADFKTIGWLLWERAQLVFGQPAAAPTPAAPTAKSSAKRSVVVISRKAPVPAPAPTGSSVSATRIVAAAPSVSIVNDVPGNTLGTADEVASATDTLASISTPRRVGPSASRTNGKGSATLPKDATAASLGTPGRRMLEDRTVDLTPRSAEAAVTRIMGMLDGPAAGKITSLLASAGLAITVTSPTASQESVTAPTDPSPLLPVPVAVKPRKNGKAKQLAEVLENAEVVEPVSATQVPSEAGSENNANDDVKKVDTDGVVYSLLQDLLHQRHAADVEHTVNVFDPAYSKQQLLPTKVFKLLRDLCGGICAYETEGWTEALEITQESKQITIMDLIVMDDPTENMAQFTRHYAQMGAVKLGDQTWETIKQTLFATESIRSGTAWFEVSKMERGFVTALCYLRTPKGKAQLKASGFASNDLDVDRLTPSSAEIAYIKTQAKYKTFMRAQEPVHAGYKRIMLLYSLFGSFVLVHPTLREWVGTTTPMKTLERVMERLAGLVKDSDLAKEHLRENECSARITIRGFIEATAPEEDGRHILEYLNRFWAQFPATHEYKRIH
uniref:Uncharacterized protein n=1 Tax=Mycena chlorophos TaxID=658473 RepID=A0ABQ0L662_MYCCL|nr:predicted protein [Mycena chlorophos]